MAYNAIDLFSGCGGLTLGLKEAGFRVLAAVEVDSKACDTYRANHPDVPIIQKDIREISDEEISRLVSQEPLHLLAGCPPCQGFSSVRRLNKAQEKADPRNDLIWEYFRFVRVLKPLVIMMENVPGLGEYKPFLEMVEMIRDLGYNLKTVKVSIHKYGIPQRRQRLVMIGSRLGSISLPPETGITGTVKDAIGDLESPETTADPLHRRFPRHTERIMNRIRLTPQDGGSRSDIPEMTLPCHQKDNIGFHDIYGRLRWNAPSSTITGGCLNPSKGRFLHPIENRCITAREAALLQTFPRSYIFPSSLPITHLALQIGNALPPEFGRIQAESIYNYLKGMGID